MSNWLPLAVSTAAGIGVIILGSAMRKLMASVNAHSRAIMEIARALNSVNKEPSVTLDVLWGPAAQQASMFPTEDENG